MWFRVRGLGQLASGTYVLVVGGLQIEIGGAALTPLQWSASAVDGSSGPSNLADSDPATFWQTASAVVPQSTHWAAVRTEDVPFAGDGVLRLQTANKYPETCFKSATLEFSTNSTDGSNGSWVVLLNGTITSSSVISTWTEHPFPFPYGATRPLSRPPLPAILSCPPASLTRGFR